MNGNSYFLEWQHFFFEPHHNIIRQFGSTAKRAKRLIWQLNSHFIIISEKQCVFFLLVRSFARQGYVKNFTITSQHHHHYRHFFGHSVEMGSAAQCIKRALSHIQFLWFLKSVEFHAVDCIVSAQWPLWAAMAATASVCVRLPWENQPKCTHTAQLNVAMVHYHGDNFVVVIFRSVFIKLYVHSKQFEGLSKQCLIISLSRSLPLQSVSLQPSVSSLGVPVHVCVCVTNKTCVKKADLIFHIWENTNVRFWIEWVW